MYLIYPLPQQKLFNILLDQSAAGAGPAAMILLSLPAGLTPAERNGNT
jgi:hypothetical protein